MLFIQPVQERFSKQDHQIPKRVQRKARGVMSNDLSSLWMSNEVKYQKKKVKELEKAYEALKNKSTSYAKGIHRMFKLRLKIIEVINDKTI